MLLNRISLNILKTPVLIPSVRFSTIAFTHNTHNTNYNYTPKQTTMEEANSSNSNKIQARVLPPTEQSLKEAAQLIRGGGLVGFPTETVYGLGANALDANAVLRIFQAKGRPLTDPVIVHIASKEQAPPLLELSPTLQNVFDLLATSFWPGPLTIVSKSSAQIPMLVTANTGFVGVRHPRHEIAQALIRHAGVPIAAPSANRFGHVSPTTASHVVEDLGAHPIIVLDGGETACGVGIESTVVKLVEDGEKGGIEVLRRGGISTQALHACLDPQGIKITLPVRKTQAVANPIGMESPGQLLTHYAPDVPAYILTEASKGRQNSKDSLPLSECVLVDFGGILQAEKHKFLAYKDLSSSRTVAEAANTLFSVLRWSETVAGAKAVLLPDLQSTSVSSLEHSDAVFDRVSILFGVTLSSQEVV